jgi:hypothetical protein
MNNLNLGSKTKSLAANLMIFFLPFLMVYLPINGAKTASTSTIMFSIKTELPASIDLTS